MIFPNYLTKKNGNISIPILCSLFCQFKTTIMDVLQSGRESNPHAILGQGILSPSCLPIPPPDQIVKKKYRGGWQRTTIPPISIVPCGASPTLYFPLNKAFPFKTIKGKPSTRTHQSYASERSSIRVTHVQSARPVRVSHTYHTTQSSKILEGSPPNPKVEVGWQVVVEAVSRHRQFIQRLCLAPLRTERLSLVPLV